jgi:hypothetical protein
MTLKLAAAFLVLSLASAARADSSCGNSSCGTYDLSAFAGFVASDGEVIDISYSYQITISPQDFSSTGLNFIVTDSAGNDWTLDYFAGGEFAVDDGPLQFATSLESCCNGIYIDQEMYNAQGPTGEMLPQSWSATPVATPETPTWLLLLAGVVLLLAWGSANNEPGQP